MTPTPGSARNPSNTGRPPERASRATRRRLTSALVSVSGMSHAEARERIAATVADIDGELSDEALMRALMRAPWFPKPHRRHWRVGEGGGWATRGGGPSAA